MIKIIVLINALVFFFFFCYVFIKTWVDSMRCYMFSLDKKPVINISKKYQIIMILLFVNLFIVFLLEKIIGLVR